MSMWQRQCVKNIYVYREHVWNSFLQFDYMYLNDRNFSIYLVLISIVSSKGSIYAIYNLTIVIFIIDIN